MTPTASPRYSSPIATAPATPQALPQPISPARATPGTTSIAGSRIRTKPAACDHTTTANVEARRAASPPQKSAAP